MSRCCCSACFVWLFEVLETELRALQMLAEHPTADASSPHDVLSKGMMIRQWTSNLGKLTGTFKSSVLSEFMLPFSSD